MAVDEGGRRAFGVEPLAVDDRVAAGLEQPDVLEADPLEVAEEPPRGGLHVGGVLGRGADARDAQELAELVDVPPAGVVEIVGDGGFHGRDYDRAAMGFSREERDRRWERARGLMDERGWEALLVSGEDGLCGGNFRYLADFRPVKGHTLLLLPLEGEPVLWVEHRVHEQAAKKLSFVADSRYTLDCGEAAAEELAERGLHDGVVGSEELTLLPAAWYMTWADRLPGLRLVDASPELAQLRRVKSAEEIELCRRSCEIADGSYEHLLPKLHEGMTELEIDAELEYYCRLERRRPAVQRLRHLVAGRAAVVGLRPRRSSAAARRCSRSHRSSAATGRSSSGSSRSASPRRSWPRCTR